MNYRMIVLDLDGTLTNRDKVITPHTKAMLMEAQKRGKIVALASGRPSPGVIPLTEELELERYGGYILSFNGGIIKNCKSGEVVCETLLPVEANKKIAEQAKEHRVALMTYRGNELLTDQPDCEYVRLEARISNLKIVKAEDMASDIDFAVPKMIMTDDGDYLSTVEGKVKAALGKNFSVYRSEPFFLEILPKGIDKAQCLDKLLRKIGIGREEIIACGDGYNDLTMIQYAGLGVAMENAVLPVRNAADFITYSNNEDGVAHVVEKFLL